MTKSRDARTNTDPLANAHADGGTRRTESPELEGRVPLPEELTGRASGTDDDLVALFDNTSGDHLADGFRGGSDDEDVDDAALNVNAVETQDDDVVEGDET